MTKGNGVFSTLGEEVYDDYWMYYLTNDMAKALEIPRPYTNLKSYLDYKQKGIAVLEQHKEEIEKLSAEDDLQAHNGEENDE
ncbi:type II restriction endonuclease [Runella sp.]|uniref:type II restriction endonuclease n=1 Tax=Runella sp. TaxID=1960881 RepID=UPI002609D6E8|nr:type II restriction endonuclease [Runella sp.]